MSITRLLVLTIAALWPLSVTAQMPSAGQMDPGALAVIPEISVLQDWQIVCAASGCQAEPRVAGDPNLSVSVVQDGSVPVLIVHAPLGLLLGEGIAVTVDGRALGRLGFMTCEADGCVAPVRLDGALNRALRGGTSVTLTLSRRDGTVITGTYSLLGFIAAMNSLELNQRGEAATP